MIQVDFFLIKENTPVGLLVKGHSGLSEKGSDILCAAVSVLTENLGESITRILGVNAKIIKSDGFYSIRINLNQASPQTELLFSSVLLGLQVLQKQYPNRIYINFIKE